MLRSVFFVSILVTALTFPALGQQSTQADFEEFLQIMEGRYICDVIWIADWPGVGGKKGEKVTGYSDLQVVADGNVLQGTFYGGSGTTTWITVYDAAARQIRFLTGTSGGTMWSGTYHKEGGKWVEAGIGSNPDGSKIEFSNTLTLSDGGRTHNWSGSTTIAGKPVDKLQDVCRRVSEWQRRATSLQSDSQ